MNIVFWNFTKHYREWWKITASVLNSLSSSILFSSQLSVLADKPFHNVHSSNNKDLLA